MIHDAFSKDHACNLRRLLDYRDAVERSGCTRFRELSRKLVAQFPPMPIDAREGPQKIENKPETKAALLDKHDWEPWEIGPKITLDNCRTGLIVVR